jgi:hypothetical protein
MKDIFADIGKILGLVFAAAVIAYTSLLTWQLAARIIPNNAIGQGMTLVLFDIAALVWFVQFVTQAKGTLQWAFAGIGFAVGLFGAIIMAAGELVLGQKLVAIDDPSKIGWVLISTVIIAALAHATLIYLFHFTEPAVKNRIENAQEVSKAIEHAYKDARAEISRNVDTLTAGLMESTLFEARQQIGAATASHIRNAGLLQAKTAETLKGGPVIEGVAKDAPSKTKAVERKSPRPRPAMWKRPARVLAYASETAQPSPKVTDKAANKRAAIMSQLGVDEQTAADILRKHGALIANMFDENGNAARELTENEKRQARSFLGLTAHETVQQPAKNGDGGRPLSLK